MIETVDRCDRCGFVDDGMSEISCRKCGVEGCRECISYGLCAECAGTTSENAAEPKGYGYAENNELKNQGVHDAFAWVETLIEDWRSRAKRESDSGFSDIALHLDECAMELETRIGEFSRTK